MATTDAPGSVAIVAMGASVADFVSILAQHGGLNPTTDEVWAINAIGGVLPHDRMFVLDHVAELEAQRERGVKVATGMLEWLPDHPGPVYMPEHYDAVPGSVRYPIEDVIDAIGFPYLNNSVAYALAYALVQRVPDITLYGCDFTYPNQHRGESGRGCVEWLMGQAGRFGARVTVTGSSTLLDAYKPIEDRLYGYPEGVYAEPDEETGQWRVVWPEDEPEPVYIGGGVYELPDGSRVRGKDAAREAMGAT